MLKRLADAYGAELVGYLGGIEGIASCEAVGGEVEMTHRLTDRLYRVKTRGDGKEETFLVHLEFESLCNPRMGRRLGMYGWGLCEKEELPVMHIVWQVGMDAPSYWPKGAWQRKCNETMEVRGEQHASVRWLEVWLSGGYEAASFGDGIGCGADREGDGFVGGSDYFAASTRGWGTDRTTNTAKGLIAGAHEKQFTDNERRELHAS